MLIKLYLQEAVQRAFLVSVVYIVLKGIYLAMMKKEVHVGKEILYCVTLTYMVTLLGYTMLPNIHMGIESSGKFYFICDRWGNGRINFNNRYIFVSIRKCQCISLEGCFRLKSACQYWVVCPIWSNSVVFPLVSEITQMYYR